MSSTTVKPSITSKFWPVYWPRSVKKNNKVFMISHNETGNYTRLSFEILFERSASWTVMTVMVPYTMLLIIAWFTYWLHPKVWKCYDSLIQYFLYRNPNTRVGGSYEYSLVAANILLCTYFNKKVQKKALKSPATSSALALKICYYDFPYVQGQLTEVPLNFDIFAIKVVG